jgi:DNA-binding PadR family transcriptional regulator
MILLAAIKEKPSYAYEIDKMLESKNMRDWLKIGVASVYQVLDRLEKKGLLKSKREREGRMPVRKRYSITDGGEAHLKKDVKKLLMSSEAFYLNLNVGLECSVMLTAQDLKESIKSRLNKSKGELEKIKENFEEKKFFLPLRERLIYKNLIEFRETEEKLLKKILQEV